jgi:hypothetical protein
METFKPGETAPDSGELFEIDPEAAKLRTGVAW